jgi:phosphoadenylyl-sulfate reductase (thioredoxin)
VRPLERKLHEVDAYAVGLRREQSESRESIAAVAEDRGKVKLSPLADWSSEQVRAYIAEHNVPQHPLYEKGYPSIGCGPCTRPTLPGEGERAGRWWWEESAAFHAVREGFADGGCVARTGIATECIRDLHCGLRG